MDVQKQIEYWRDGSLEAMQGADALFEKGLFAFALFFAHLAVEKALKAHVAKATRDFPPKIHNLARLAEKAGLVLKADDRDFLLAFDQYQLEGRYPDMVPAPIGREEAEQGLAKAERMRTWLIAQL